MIENPYNWYTECIEYAVKNKRSMQYGMFVLLKDNVPENIRNSYKKYLDLCIKPFLSNELHILENNKIIGFLETDNPIELEQIELFKQLVEKGYINNDIFPPKIIR